MTVQEVAERLGVCSRTVGEWIANGELRAVNVSRKVGSRKPRLRVLECDLESFLARRATDRPKERRVQSRNPMPPVEQFV